MQTQGSLPEIKMALTRCRSRLRCIGNPACMQKAGVEGHRKGTVIVMSIFSGS